MSDKLNLNRIIADQASSAIQFRQRHDTEEANAIFRSDPDNLAATYFAAGGKTLILRRPGVAAPDIRPDGAARAEARFVDGKLEVHTPVRNVGRRAGELVLIASQEDIWRQLERNILIALGLSVLATALAAAAATALVKRALRPLENLDAGIAEVSRTKVFNTQVQVRSRDEFGRLTRRFNTMLSELKTYDENLQLALDELTAARDTAEEANVMKSQFLANMSHEIRTPLNGVLGMAEVMALNPLSPAQKERLDVIQKSGSSLLAVLNDLLDLSKIEAGHVELEQAPFDIEEVASGAYAAFTSIANKSGVSFSLAIAPEAAGRWRGDSVRVRQILYNLISNALKFTQQGEVHVAIDAATTPTGKTLSILVADTGIGIAPEVLPKLFEKFVQADNTITRRFGGVGLGLTICRQLAELMDGSITVESRVGEGAKFLVMLPLTWLGPRVRLASPPVAVDSGKPCESGFDRLRILAAEDNATNQLVLKTVLHSFGVEPIIVENGRLAVEAWSRERFDLILMDIQMPELDGVAATGEIRRREAELGRDRTPIVALSANAMKHQVSEYLSAGMDAHLAKPIQIDRLYATLAAVLAGQPLAEPEYRAA
ncbi:MAG TPA: ATP-binding protein [Caulobacteraceae bacterium]